MTTFRYIITFKYLLSLLKVNGTTKDENDKSDRRGKGSIQQLHTGKAGIEGQCSENKSRTNSSRIFGRIRARKRSILQSNERKESTEGNRGQTIDNKTIVTNPFLIFYQKLKITITLIQLIDAFDSSPSFVITMFRLIWHTWKNAKILANDNGEIDIK